MLPVKQLSPFGKPGCRRGLPRVVPKRHIGTSARTGTVRLNSSDFEHFIETRFDTEKEAARRDRRTVFTHEEWKRHRSSARFVRHLSTIPASWVIRGVLWHVALFLLLALGVASMNHYHAVRGLPLPSHIAIEPMQLTSFALSLLLVFRTNASYARWQEARKKFGTITTTGKDIIRQALAWFRPDDNAGKNALARWIMALARCSMCHLRGNDGEMVASLAGILLPHELQLIQGSHHKPNFCIGMITGIVFKAGMPTELVLRVDENISKLLQAVSSCERIINTPIPVSYTRHTSRFLMIWLACLPFSLWSYCGWAMVPIAGLISFVLLGIEEIGVYIEEPFSLLPLECLCDKLTLGVQGMMREQRQTHSTMEPSHEPGALSPVEAFV